MRFISSLSEHNIPDVYVHKVEGVFLCCFK